MSDMPVQDRLNEGLTRADYRSTRRVDLILISEADYRALSEESIAFVKRQKSRFRVPDYLRTEPGNTQIVEWSEARERARAEEFIAGKGIIEFNGVRLLLARVDDPMYLHDLSR